MGYQSSIPFRGDRIHTAAVYCSDGRFGEQFDDFLTHRLGNALCDRLAVPGGPASLGRSTGLPEESSGVSAQLEFLVRVHDVRQVILVGHIPCAFYRERLAVADDAQHDAQVRDLGGAARRLRSLAPLQVDAFVARVVDARVQFLPVAV